MNRWQLLLCFAVGVWAGGTLFMWMVATQNFQTVEAILVDQPSDFAALTAELERPELREVLRYQASEVNRLFFEGWGWVQLPLALLAVGAALGYGGRGPLLYLLLGLLAIALFLQLYVVPETVELGRAIDFQPDSAMAETRARFWTLHNLYTGFDMAKMLGILTALGLALRKP